MSNLLKLILVLLLGIAGVVLGARWWLQPTAWAEAAVRGRAVEAVPAAVAVRADYLMELRSEAGGRVRTSALALGRSVRAGEEIMQIDDADLRLQLEALERNRATLQRRIAVGSATELQLATARGQLANAERQHQAGALAQVELEQQQRNVRQLEQQRALEEISQQDELDSVEAEIKARQRDIDKARLVSPIDGQVTDVLARPGDLIAPGAVVARVLSTSRVVEAKVAEEYFAGVRRGQSATVRFLGYGGEQFSATVTEVLPAADPETRRYTCHLEVQIAEERLVPGLSGEAVITVGARENAVLIPRRALLGEFVLVVEDGRVRQRRVTKGFLNLTAAEILDRVAEGDVVIVEHPERFREGERVRVRLR